MDGGYSGPYDPASKVEDFIFPHPSEGRGSKVETLDDYPHLNVKYPPSPYTDAILAEIAQKMSDEIDEKIVQDSVAEVWFPPAGPRRGILDLTDKDEDKAQGALISLIRRLLPQIIANVVVGVQPMTGPEGEIFSIRPNLSVKQVEGLQSFKVPQIFLTGPTITEHKVLPVQLGEQDICKSLKFSLSISHDKISFGDIDD